MMKNILFFTFILFTFTACEKDDPDTDFTPYVAPKKVPNTNDGTTTAGTFTATIDAQSYVSTSTSAFENAGIIGISGLDAENNLNITFLTTHVPDTYDFTNQVTGNLTTGTGSSVKSYRAQGYGLILTAIDTAAKTAQGTFEFTAYNSNDPNDSIHVTNGVFDITYTQPTPP